VINGDSQQLPLAVVLRRSLEMRRRTAGHPTMA
jgi:hypothetical protein